MAAAIGHEMADQIAARQGQVANQIQSLVPHAFVPETQLVIDRPVAVENQQVAFGDARLAQALGPAANRPRS